MKRATLWNKTKCLNHTLLAPKTPRRIKRLMSVPGLMSKMSIATRTPAFMSNERRLARRAWMSVSGDWPAGGRKENTRTTALLRCCQRHNLSKHTVKHILQCLVGQPLAGCGQGSGSICVMRVRMSHFGVNATCRVSSLVVVCDSVTRSATCNVIDFKAVLKALDY